MQPQDYEQEMIESIRDAIESAKERQPIRADVYLKHINYYANKLIDAHRTQEELKSIKSEIDYLKQSYLELIFKFHNRGRL